MGRLCLYDDPLCTSTRPSSNEYVCLGIGSVDNDLPIPLQIVFEILISAEAEDRWYRLTCLLNYGKDSNQSDGISVIETPLIYIYAQIILSISIVAKVSITVSKGSI